MIPDDELERGPLTFGDWATTPSTDDLTPEGEARKSRSKSITRSLHNEPDAVVITHNDADGLGAGALIRFATDGDTIVIPVGHNTPYQAKDVLIDVKTWKGTLSDTDVYITDLGTDLPVKQLADVALSAGECHWLDHHQWDEPKREAVRAAGWSLTIDTGQCATSIVLDELVNNPPNHIIELAEVTNDHDMWIHDIEWSDRLGAAAMAFDDETYMRRAVDQGPRAVAEADEVDGWLDTQEQLEDYAVDDTVRLDVYGFDIAFTYTRAARTSEIGNELVEGRDADLAVVMGTDGSVHLYSHSDPDECAFPRCHELAGELGGGGHETAAGASLPFDTFHQRAKYWSSKGRTMRPIVLDALRKIK